MIDTAAIAQNTHAPSSYISTRGASGHVEIRPPGASMGEEQDHGFYIESVSDEPRFYELQSTQPVPCHNRYTSLKNILEKEGKPIRRSSPSDVNLSYLREVILNKKILEISQELLTSVFHECRRQQPGYIDSLLPNLGFLLFAQPTFLERLCRCGQNHHRCKMRFWCPRCAYAKAVSLWKTYLPNYREGTFWFLTVSITGEIPFGHQSSSHLRSLWTLLPEFLNQVRKTGFGDIRGFYSSNEVSVRQFLPLVICPHVHFVVDADSLDSDFHDLLEHFINYQLAKLAPDCTLKSDVHLRAITSQASLKSALRYIVKPISLRNQYKTAWTTKVETCGHCAWEINNEVRDFITGISHVSHYPEQMRHLKPYGSMNASSKHTFIGVVEARRNDNWDEIQAIPLTDDQWANYNDQQIGE